MSIEEKIKIINEYKNKNFLYISPKTIQGGARLITNQQTLELYEKINENTLKFVEEETINLKTSRQKDKLLSFTLIFCGDFEDLPNKLGNPFDFIQENQDKIIAIHEFIIETTTREFFVGFLQTEEINKYGYMYLNLKTLFEEFDKNDIEFKIDKNIDRFRNRNDLCTKFIISKKSNS